MTFCAQYNQYTSPPPGSGLSGGISSTAPARNKTSRGCGCLYLAACRLSEHGGSDRRTHVKLFVHIHGCTLRYTSNSAVREPLARRRRERCHEGSRWRPSPGSLAQPTTLRDRRPIVMSLSRTGAPLEVMSTHRFQSIVNCKGGKGPSTPACNPRATAHHCSARDAVAGPTPNATAHKRDSAHIGREGGETRAVGCGRLSQGQTMRAEGRHVPHMSPFTVELILTAVHC